MEYCKETLNIIQDCDIDKKYLPELDLQIRIIKKQGLWDILKNRYPAGWVMLFKSQWLPCNC